MKRLLVGLINGLIAGAVAGLLLNQGKERAEAEEPATGERAIPTDPVARARASFEQGRERVRAGRARPGDVPAGAPVMGEPVNHTVAPAPASPIIAWRDGLRARWQEAVDAGKEASAEKQTELRRKYLEQTGRLSGGHR